LNNCIVYYNTAADGRNNYNGGTLNFCCTTPLPNSGLNNIITEPQLADSAHVSAGSPCIGASSPSYTTGVDIDGESWANPPSIGCDEFIAGAVTGPLNVAIQTAYTSVAAGFAVNFTAVISGHAGANVWNFGDGTIVSNRLYVSHAWVAAGDYPVTLKVFNNTSPGGVSAMVMIHVVPQPVHYVSQASPAPVPPYASWATAATNIQDAIDAASVPGALVLASNGVYQAGGRIVSGLQSNRVVVTRPLTLASLNGPAVTVIQGNPVIGDSAVRCIYLTPQTTLSGFTLTQGATTLGSTFQENTGGGIYCESSDATITNCLITGNAAVGGAGGVCRGTVNDCILSSNTVTYYFSYGVGGGAYAGVLNNCVLYANAAGWAGGGAEGSTLINCTVCYNSAIDLWYFSGGDGTHSCTLNNCIIYYNANGDDCQNCTLNFCCSTAASGYQGNIANPPLFVNSAGGDFHLQTNSPCINSGNNALATGNTDFDGNPRIRGGTVDIGAYEFQNPTSVISYAWLQKYGLPTDGTADYVDTDGDGFNNWQEWRTGTSPTDPSSLLKLMTITPDVSGTTLTWQSGSGITYFLQRSTNLLAQPAFQTIATDIAGQAGTTSYTDTTATNAGPYFYRVGVQ